MFLRRCEQSVHKRIAREWSGRCAAVPRVGNYSTRAGHDTVEEIDMIRRGQVAAVVSRLTHEQQERALRTFTELRQVAEAIEATN